MSTKNLLLIGSAAWVAYMLYSNMQRDKHIRELRKQVSDTQAQLRASLEGRGKDFTLPPKYINPEDFSKDAAIFPAGVNQQYNACKGVTVAPPPVKVTSYISSQ